MHKAQANRRTIAARVAVLAADQSALLTASRDSSIPVSGNRPASNRPASNLLVRIPACQPRRCVGSLGKRTPKPRYAGSGTDGYRSAWAQQGHDFYTDARWGQTVSSQHA